MDEDDDFGGYGSDEPSVRAVKKTTSTSNGAKGKTNSAKAATTTAKATRPAVKPAAARGRGKPTGSRTKGRNASAEDEEEAEVIDIEVSEDEEEEDVEMEEPEVRRSARGKRGESSKAPVKAVNGKVTSGSKAAASAVEDDNNVAGDEEALRQELAKLKAQLTRRTEERDTFAKQFKELEGKKGGEMEKLYDKLKDKSQSKGDAQDKIIETLNQLNEKLTSKVKSLEGSLAETKKTLSTTQDELARKVETEKRQAEEKAVPMQVEKAAEVPAPAAVATGSKETEEEVKKWKSEAKRMRSRVEEKETEINTLKKDLEAEVKIAQEALSQAERRAAAAALTGSVAGPTSAKEIAADREQNEQVIKLYEDLTNLMIPQVKIVKGGNGDEITFVCVQTVQGRSLNYKLRCFKQASEDPARAGSWIYTKVMQYLPIGLDLEKDKTFLEGLGLFKGAIEMPMSQASDFWTNLNEAMVPDEDEAE